MEKQTDILACLGAVVEKNTTAYQTDFEYDKAMLKEAASQPKAEDRTFYFMSRPHGTWCFKEREIFMRDSEANLTWLYYGDTPKGILTFRVHVTGFDKAGKKLLGDIQPFNYAAQVERLKKAAMPIHEITGVYADGTPFVAPRGEYNRHELAEHGGVKEKHFHPENEDELQVRIMQEHHNQTHPNRQAPKRKSPSR